MKTITKYAIRIQILLSITWNWLATFSVLMKIKILLSRMWNWLTIFRATPRAFVKRDFYKKRLLIPIYN